MALLTAILGVALSISKIKVNRPNTEKLNLEIENLKLDIEEKRRKLNPDAKPVSKDEAPKTKEKIPPVYYSGLWSFSRYSVGFLAILFPAALVAGSMLLGGQQGVLRSMGDYYYTNMRDIYVGTHLVIAVILFSYMGYARIDFFVSKMQGLFCLLMGFCPTGSNTVLSIVHFVSFSCFLLLQSFFSLYLFTRTDRSATIQKRFRNRIYRICGIIIVVCLLLLASYSLFQFTIFSSLETAHPVFYTEAIAYWAFGVSWLLKGEFILKDH